MILFPAIDIKNGSCVRLVQGKMENATIFNEDPVEQAKIYDGQGADELCFLDITASSDKRNTLLDVVAETAEQCFMPLTVGGGVRKIEDIKNLLLAGADKVSINTAAVKNENLVKESTENP